MVRSNGHRGWVEVNTKLAVVLAAVAILAIAFGFIKNVVLASEGMKDLTVTVDKHMAKQCSTNTRLVAVDSLFDKRLTRLEVVDSIRWEDVSQSLREIKRSLSRGR